MVPSTEVAVPSEPEAKHTGSPDTLVLEPRTPEISTTQPVSRPVPSPLPSSIRTPEEGSFRASLLEYNRMKSSSRPLDILISLLMNVAILSAPILVGLYFTDTINLKQLESTFLGGPTTTSSPASCSRNRCRKALRATQGLRKCRQIDCSHLDSQKHRSH